MEDVALTAPDIPSSEEILKNVAKKINLRRTISYDLGLYGKVGSSTVFVSTTDRIADYDRLYWVMVRVLAEKYGCFIKNKRSTEARVSFWCRDGRKVVFKRSLGQKLVHFSGRQFDAQGRELIVDNHRILERRKIRE